MEYCTCEEQKISENSNDYIYERCINCKNPIRRKPNMCLYALETGYCELAERNNYTYSCKVNGDFTKCKNGKRSE